MRSSGIFLLILFIAGCRSASHIPSVREGDIVFQVLRSGQGPAIQLATKSHYTHMGIVLFKNDQPYVFEAVEPVRFTALDKWIARGEKGHCVIKRLNNAEQILDAQALNRMRRIVPGFEGKHYDLTFGWDDSTIYCSELVWKVYDRALGIQVGNLHTLKDFDLSSTIVQEKIRERYGSRVPLDETVISPKDIFDSELLTTVEIIN
jgi:hypothetical protein